jgi:GT2 family glycosyltransferase
MEIKISYGICVCNEFVEIQRLVSHLLKFKREQDEIVILYDDTNGSEGVKEYLHSHSVNGEFIWYKGNFEGDFSKWKNKLTSLCSGDFIFNIDADEIPHINLIENLPEILSSNDIDVILVPRVNTVEGLTDEHIQKWGWRVNQEGWVNWPDYQWRIYKKDYPKIQWDGKVHEKIVGYSTYTWLPEDVSLSLQHYKTIKKQEKQNSLYNSL